MNFKSSFLFFSLFSSTSQTVAFAPQTSKTQTSVGSALTLPGMNKPSQLMIPTVGVSSAQHLGSRETTSSTALPLRKKLGTIAEAAATIAEVGATSPAVEALAGANPAKIVVEAQAATAVAPAGVRSPVRDVVPAALAAEDVDAAAPAVPAVPAVAAVDAAAPAAPVPAAMYP